MEEHSDSIGQLFHPVRQLEWLAAKVAVTLMLSYKHVKDKIYNLYMNHIDKEQIQQIECFLNHQASFMISYALDKTYMEEAIFETSCEIYKWLRFHQDHSIPNSIAFIQWKQNGQIDYRATAEFMLVSGDLNYYQKMDVIELYCLEEHFALLESVLAKQDLFRAFSFCCIHPDCTYSSLKKSYEDEILITKSIQGEEQMHEWLNDLSDGGSLAVFISLKFEETTKYIWNLLSPKSKKDVLSRSINWAIESRNANILLFFLSKISEDMLNKIFVDLSTRILHLLLTDPPSWYLMLAIFDRVAGFMIVNDHFQFLKDICSCVENSKRRQNLFVDAWKRIPRETKAVILNSWDRLIDLLSCIVEKEAHELVVYILCQLQMKEKQGYLYSAHGVEWSKKLLDVKNVNQFHEFISKVLPNIKDYQHYRQFIVIQNYQM